MVLPFNIFNECGSTDTKHQSLTAEKKSHNASFITWSTFMRGMQPVTRYQDRTIVTSQVSPSITQIHNQKNISFWDMQVTYSFQYLLSVFVLQKGENKYAMLLFLSSFVFSFPPLGANFCFSLSACCTSIGLGHHPTLPLMLASHGWVQVAA